MNRYIVKNCPAYSRCRYEGYTCHYQGPEDRELDCEDNPDCLIKQLIEDFLDDEISELLQPEEVLDEKQ